MFYIFSRLKTTPFGLYHSSWAAPIDPHVLQPAYASLHQHQQSAVQPTYASLQPLQPSRSIFPNTVLQSFSDAQLTGSSYLNLSFQIRPVQLQVWIRLEVKSPSPFLAQDFQTWR